MDPIELCSQVIFGAVFGACTGSFVAVVIERVPERRSVNGRSRCACGRPLRPYENVPLVAWPLLGGRARCCGAVIPAWYWLVELAAAAIGAAAAGLGALGVPTPVRAAVAVAGWVALALGGLARRRRRGDAPAVTTPGEGT